MTWSWTRENTSPGFIPSSMPRLSRRATPAEHVLLAEPQHRELVLRVEQPGLLVPLVAAGQQVADPLEELVHVRPLDHGLDARALATKRTIPSWSSSWKLAGVVGEQPLGDQLQQDGVVALERGEDVGVRLERREPVTRRGSPRRRTPRGTPGWCGSRARCRAPWCRPRATRARGVNFSSSASTRRTPRGTGRPRPPARSAARRCGPAAGTAAAGAARSRAAAPPRPRCVASNWRRLRA